MEQLIAEVETVQKTEPTKIPTTEFEIVNTNDTISNRGRSSSLSDLDTSPVEDPTLTTKPQFQTDVDSEADTEKIDNSPDKAAKRTSEMITSKINDIKDSQLVEATVIEQTGDAALSDSEISTRSASPTDPMSAGFAESLATSLERQSSPKKRKRESDDEDQDRRLRQRTASTRSSLSQELEKPGEFQSETVDHDEPEVEKADPERQQTSTRTKKAKAVEVKAIKKSKRLNPQENQSNDEDENDSAEALAETSHLSSDEDDSGEVEDDPETAARNEHEAEKHNAARTSLVELEKQFAVLRDKLYDERIRALQNELAQVRAIRPTHPEFLRQAQCLQAYRDDKKIKEVRLWEYKVETLRRTSAGEVSIRNNIYRRKAGEIREHYLEKANDSFYKIHKERFKTEPNIENYGIQFPTDRLTQVTHQTAYNKEVSINAGLAKYKGFPAAPGIPVARSTELDDDLAKMGIVDSAAPSHRAPSRKSAPARSMPLAISEPNAAAEEQFLENTPWANPRHPANNSTLNRATSQQQSAQPSLAHAYTTPAAQRQVDLNALNGSASTIAENYSAPTSSAMNTPYGMDRERHNGSAANGPASNEKRKGQKTHSNHTTEDSQPSSVPNSHPRSVGATETGLYSATPISPTLPRHNVFHSPSRPDSLPRSGIDHTDLKSRQQTASSPLVPLHQHEGSGLQGRVGIR